MARRILSESADKPVPCVFKIYLWQKNRPRLLGRIVTDYMRFPPIADLPAIGLEARAVDRPRLVKRTLGVRGPRP